MPQLPPPDHEAADATSQRRVLVPNSHGENLVGLLHETGSKKVVVLCHGFRSSKDEKVFLNLTAALTSQGYSVFRFDFAGNGESEGIFRYGNYWREAEDLRAVILYLSKQKYEISAILGHSKGGNVVILYASKYHDVNTVINLSGRFALDKGIQGRLGKDFMQRIKKEGFIDVKDRTGKVDFRATEESLMDRLRTDMRSACHNIDNQCRVLIVHGSDDEIVPAEDSLEFAKIIPNHKLHVIEGANHAYTKQHEELCKIVLNFMESSEALLGSGKNRAVLSKL